MTRRAGVSPSGRATRKLPHLVALWGCWATIGTLGRQFINFVVVSNVKSVGEFHSLERLCFNVSTDGLKCGNDQGSEGNLLVTKVSKIVKFQGQKI